MSGMLKDLPNFHSENCKGQKSIDWGVSLFQIRFQFLVQIFKDLPKPMTSYMAQLSAQVSGQLEDFLRPRRDGCTRPPTSVFHGTGDVPSDTWQIPSRLTMQT